MDDDQLIEGLRSLEPPDAAAARARANELVRAAHAGRRPVPRERLGRWVFRRSRRPALLGTVFAGAIALSLSLTAVHGAAVGRWVRDALRSSGGHPTGQSAALAALPGGGRLLVSTGRDAWIVGQGLTRAVGHTTGGAVTWSAFGNYIACACGQDLQAVALNGRVAWTEHFPATVRAPSWSPDGNRIAFAVGRDLYVTAGDGTGAHAVGVSGHATALVGLAAWRPGPGHELAVHDKAGQVSLIDADTGRRLARIPIGRHAVSLGWSGDGRLLLAASAEAVRVYNSSGRLVADRRPPAGTTLRAAELAPSGRQIALMASRPDGRHEALLASIEPPRSSRVVLLGGTLGELLFSPDGRWLLVGWHDLDSWMFFTTAADRAQVRQITHVSAAVGHGKPVVAAWCCIQPPGSTKP